MVARRSGGETWTPVLTSAAMAAKRTVVARAAAGT
jgi:hypothetical protein